jgi:hypothetical protein
MRLFISVVAVSVAIARCVRTDNLPKTRPLGPGLVSARPMALSPSPMRAQTCALGVLLVVTSGADAARPGVGGLVKAMKAVLEPSRPSIRKMTVVISAQDGEATRWVAGQARKQFKDGNRILIAILAPADQKGAAYLLRELPKQGNDEEWLYVPTVRRVRKLLPVESFRAFLESDFTLSDLGFVNLRSTYKLLREEKRGDVRAYKIEEIPGAPQAKWYYSRIVTWLAADSTLPLERDFYDPSNTLWKVETFEQVTDINGTPTPLRIRMQDKEEGGSTEIDVSEVRYDVDVPDSLFDPAHLRDAAGSPLW